ncbi:NADP-specific glutamate dehydrogenase [Cytophagaceae bacterium ABcell3]|nr:NADP-specific glutamate dehydrogenase [Cytophagaceae bacterium ABcell3]
MSENKEDELIARVRKINPHEKEFLQAVEEVVHSVRKVFERHPEYKKLKILERIVEPERIITFRVCWQDDQGEVQVNRGYRVQMNSAIGPYKGGLRFHPSVNYSILKFLAFEQIFKNALTSLPMGGGKGGADFDPKGKSDAEIMRFCHAYMQELYRHIGAFTDIPAGDIGVGSREIGYLFGMYKKIRNEFTGVLTGKGEYWGGSVIRPEATGYGLIYFASNMLKTKNDSLKGKRCLVSGSGNVAQFAIEKLIHEGGIPISASDSDGCIIDHEGIDMEKLEFIKKIKNQERRRIKAYIEKYPHAEYHPCDGKGFCNPIWTKEADCAFPCAVQNEISKNDAENLIANGIKLIAEGANMPCTSEAIELIQKSKILYAPGKAANAGGVAVSGLEMTQNRMGVYWNNEDVDAQLKGIMKNIHDVCLQAAEEYDMPGNYLEGANIFGFLKVAEAMKAQGVV